MIEFSYEMLSQIGLTHPLHPPATHLPMGLAIAAFLFAMASLIKPDLERTAHYCAVLALLSVLTAVPAGLMDWQHFYEGQWSGLFIAKFILTGFLLFFLIAAVKVGWSEPRNFRVSVVLYALCMFTALALGFTGGEIQYG